MINRDGREVAALVTASSIAAMVAANLGAPCLLSKVICHLIISAKGADENYREILDFIE